jgi:hypothetical protein
MFGVKGFFLSNFLKGLYFQILNVGELVNSKNKQLGIKSYIALA